MSFKTKYNLRNYFIDFIGLFFSFTFLLLVYAKIEDIKFMAYKEWVAGNHQYNFIDEMNVSHSAFRDLYVDPIYYWIPFALLIDVGIRYGLKMYYEDK